MIKIVVLLSIGLMKKFDRAVLVYSSRPASGVKRSYTLVAWIWSPMCGRLLGR